MAVQQKSVRAKRGPMAAAADSPETIQDTKKFLRKIGRKIAEVRSQQGHTQVHFADQVGVCVKMVQYWESGQNITLKTLYKIARQLGQPVESFLQEAPAHAPESSAFRLPPTNGDHSGLEPKLASLNLRGQDASGPTVENAKSLLRMNLASWFQPHNGSNGSNHKLRILVVEDNSGDVRLLKDSFREWADGDFDLVYESTAEGALKCLAQEKIDLILLDLFLPDVAGLDAIRVIEKDHSQTPLIILTGLYDELVASEALQLGADFFLSKGFAEVKALIKSLHDYAEFKKGSHTARPKGNVAANKK